MKNEKEDSTGNENSMSLRRRVGAGILLAVVSVTGAYGGIRGVEKAVSEITSHNPDYNFDGVLSNLPAK